MTERAYDIAVIGAGAWGTALAMHCQRLGHRTLLWAHEPATAEHINQHRENQLFLPGHRLPDGLMATTDLEQAVRGAPVLLTVMPTPHVARLAAQMVPWLGDDHAIVSCSKGIDNESLETVNEIFERVLPRRLQLGLAYLSGPSFAAEVAAQLPTAVTIASLDRRLGKHLQKLLSSERFRCYTTSDVTGVEMGGALKNVMAIAAGICDGLQLGHNARAALITRGLAEITRFGVALGAVPATFTGLAGLGDLVLTCTGDLSRNRRVGLAMAAGVPLATALAELGHVAEGVACADVIGRRGHELGVDLPIVNAVRAVLAGRLGAREAVLALLAREPKRET